MEPILAWFVLDEVIPKALPLLNPSGSSVELFRVTDAGAGLTVRHGVTRRSCFYTLFYSPMQ